MTPGPRYLEDFAPGQEIRTSSIVLTESEIIEFARRFDPQPFHLDAEAGRRSIYGGLIASGFQTMWLTFRLFVETAPLGENSLGSPGMDEVRWLRPVRPGDTLRVVAHVVEVKPSTSKPDRGVVTLTYTTLNQRDEPVLTMTGKQLLKRRPA